MIDISVVSGTYNRLSLLKKMVNSARRSVEYNLSLDFVLVDGGSTDGTIEWSKKQEDVTLIEHGQLLGAVKAFNDGAFTATGEYVIMANDDIEFVGKSIYYAWLFMQIHSSCGVGCFYQDRGKKSSDPDKWHVENMPVVIGGKQSMAPYGQVCMVPKWLGDRVSWWMDSSEYVKKAAETRDKNIKLLRTYAGDCELSSRVYELGYKVTPISKARIHDSMPKDELRTINNIGGGTDPKSVKGHHPDSWSWGRKWRDPITGHVGAKVAFETKVPNSSVFKPRVLYLPIYEPGWEVQKEQKAGLRQALESVGLCVEYDYMTRHTIYNKEVVMSDLVKLIADIKPTLVLTQLHNSAIINSDDIRALKLQATLAKFVNWNGDYWPEQLLDDAGLELAKSFDLMTSVNLDVVENHQALGINTKYWQIGYEPNGVVSKATVNYDIAFLASGYSEARQKLTAQLKGLPYSLGLYGNGWPEGWSKGENLYNFAEAAGIYMGSKFAIGDSQWPDSGFVSNRVMQILAAGSCVLTHQWFRGMENLGLIDGETCLIWHTFDELKQKLKQYIAKESERARIATNGQQLAFREHSFSKRVSQLFEMLDTSKTEESWRW